MNIGTSDGASTSPVLDSDTVRMLKELGGPDAPDLFNELVDTFVSDSGGRIDAIEASARSGAMDRIASEAHSLKSSAGNMGATQLMSLCRSLEHAGRNRRVDESRRLAEQLRPEYERARDALLGARET